ncbi:MAG TPA: hypothetical protein VJX94_26555 [Stellaceae bacterium]|nr:hypothetical protein [Stellaceae bacterium]
MAVLLERSWLAPREIDMDPDSIIGKDSIRLNVLRQRDGVGRAG